MARIIVWPAHPHMHPHTEGEECDLKDSQITKLSKNRLKTLISILILQLLNHFTQEFKKIHPKPQNSTSHALHYHFKQRLKKKYICGMQIKWKYN